MKRLFLSLVSVIALGLGVMAQDSRVATLQHGANFRTYYGTDAFISAHADAADGDVITLTAGEFNACDVSKAITVRGEGMRKTILRKPNDSSFVMDIPKDSPFSLCLEGMQVAADISLDIKSTNGSASALISRCTLTTIWSYGVQCNNCNVVITDTDVSEVLSVSDKSTVTCINSKLTSLVGRTFDVNNCVITGNVTQATNSIIKNSIVYGVSTLDNTNTTSNCLVKYGSSGFANSWYVKTEPDVNPDPWGEDPETPVLWADLFGEDYHLTDAAASTYLGTDGTQVGIYGGAYPYDETPDYPLVKNLEVKGIHEDGKLQVKINVE